MWITRVNRFYIQLFNNVITAGKELFNSRVIPALILLSLPARRRCERAGGWMGEVFYWCCLGVWWGEWRFPSETAAKLRWFRCSVQLRSCLSSPLPKPTMRAHLSAFSSVRMGNFLLPLSFYPFFDGFLFWTLHYQGKRKSVFNRSPGSTSFDNLEAQNSLWEKGAQKLFTVHSGLVLVAFLLHMHIIVPRQLTRQVDHGKVGILFLEIGRIHWTI